MTDASKLNHKIDEFKEFHRVGLRQLADPSLTMLGRREVQNQIRLSSDAHAYAVARDVPMRTRAVTAGRATIGMYIQSD
jgi:hypothetical protein